jgi:hypothetical protein
MGQVYSGSGEVSPMMGGKKHDDSSAGGIVVWRRQYALVGSSSADWREQADSIVLVKGCQAILDHATVYDREMNGVWRDVQHINEVG